MGEAIAGLSEASALSGDEGSAQSIGSYLCSQRKLRGISLDELSELTRIPRRSLERLESGAFDGQPDGFARGFVRTVAAAIGLDPNETVTRMLSEPDPAAGGARAVPFRLALGLVALALLALVAAAGWQLISPGDRLRATATADAAADAPLVRRDAVRALAVEQGLVAPQRGPDPAASGPIAPGPTAPGRDAPGPDASRPAGPIASGS